MCLGDVETYNEILKRDHDLNNNSHNYSLFYCLPRKQVFLSAFEHFTILKMYSE